MQRRLETILRLGEEEAVALLKREGLRGYRLVLEGSLRFTFPVQ